jgi:hypothetical protein
MHRSPWFEVPLIIFEVSDIGKECRRLPKSLRFRYYPGLLYSEVIIFFEGIQEF